MHSHLAKMLGQYIFEQRQKLGFLQKDLAGQLDMSAQFLGRIEKGEVMIPDPALKKVIGILSLSENKLTTIYRSAGQLSVQSLFSELSAKKTKKKG